MKTKARTEQTERTEPVLWNLRAALDENYQRLAGLLREIEATGSVELRLAAVAELREHLALAVAEVERASSPEAVRAFEETVVAALEEADAATRERVMTALEEAGEL